MLPIRFLILNLIVSIENIDRIDMDPKMLENSILKKVTFKTGSSDKNVYSEITSKPSHINWYSAE